MSGATYLLLSMVSQLCVGGVLLWAELRSRRRHLEHINELLKRAEAVQAAMRRAEGGRSSQGASHV